VTHWQIFKRFYFIGIALFAILLLGVVGYMLIEGWNFMDAFFMTAITLSTIGFGEVHPLTLEGRLFTIFLILGTFGIFAFLITSITGMVASGELTQKIKDYRHIQRMKKLENHIIVCGMGRVGKQVVIDLLKADFQVVAIDQNNPLNMENTHLHFINGDATDDAVLAFAGILTAKSLITCLPNDADNMFVVLSTRSKNPTIQIIARSSKSSSVDKLRLAGANHVIMPDSIGGTHMASIVSSPEVIAFMDQLRTVGTKHINLEALTFENLPAEMHDKTLEEINFKKWTGATVVGAKTLSGEFIVSPDDTFKVEKGVTLLVLGNPKQIGKLNDYCALPNT
jgi:voltage-gated potassium channel